MAKKQEQMQPKAQSKQTPLDNLKAQAAPKSAAGLIRDRGADMEKKLRDMGL